MLFNSLEFCIFLPIVFTIYWLINHNLKLQNAFIVAASFFFYGWWDWRFLLLMVFSASIDFIVGIFLIDQQKKNKRKLLLLISLITNLGILGFFKYFNFFVDSFTTAFTFFGIHLQASSLNIVLPVGISFYTFQALSYTIDVYKKELKATKSFIDYFAFLSFFPQLVAGPIERASHLLPQFYKKRKFDYDIAVDGAGQIMWGFFKKVAIADNLSPYVNHIFENYDKYDGVLLLVGVLFFAFQIYCDFSGYSDIAIGLAKWFGFNIMTNFKLPYFSRNIVEFWSRWHISLSTWFRDYVYIPLGGSRGSKKQHIFNIIVTFTISGFWHGASWTFVIWGFLNGLYYLPYIILGKKKKLGIIGHGKLIPPLSEFIQMSGTFILVLLTWVFFRAKNVEVAIKYLIKIFDFNTYPNLYDQIYLLTRSTDYVPLFTLIVAFPVFIVAEWIQRDKTHTLMLDGKPAWLRWSFYFILLNLLFLMGNFSKNSFIYFQF